MASVATAIGRINLVPASVRAVGTAIRAGHLRVLHWTSVQREAALIGACIAIVCLAILELGLAGYIFALVEHRPDAKRDALILVCFTLSAGLAVFSFRRWRELTREMAVRIAAEARANALASKDDLTGLANRRALLAELARAIGRGERSGCQVSLLLFDLDRFKPVNDIHGHQTGDKLLRTIASRLRENVRASEFVARLGGDEFAVIVSHGAEDALAAVNAATRLTQVLGERVRIGVLDIQVGLSSGIATFPTDASDVETLMGRADVALYRAKETGRGCCALFNAQMDAEIRERADIEAELYETIASGGIVPHYQPLIDPRSGRVVGFEALARWEHPRRGFIPPSRFIPIAEDSGLINDLSLAMLRRACRDALGWGADFMLAINISPIQLANRSLADEILTILKAEGFPTRRLEVELTESALVSEIEGARLILDRLKQSGVSICLDDFGSGYSSLRHLSKMPFDRVKLDQAFVQGLDMASDPLKVIGAIVRLCTSLGLACTGEGAETAEQVALLRAAGCTLVQGWYFGAAVTAGQALELAQKGRVQLAASHAWAAEAAADDAASGVFRLYPQSLPASGYRARS